MSVKNPLYAIVTSLVKGTKKVEESPVFISLILVITPV